MVGSLALQILRDAVCGSEIRGVHIAALSRLLQRIDARADEKAGLFVLAGVLLRDHEAERVAVSRHRDAGDAPDLPRLRAVEGDLDPGDRQSFRNGIRHRDLARVVAPLVLDADGIVDRPAAAHEAGRLIGTRGGIGLLVDRQHQRAERHSGIRHHFRVRPVVFQRHFVFKGSCPGHRAVHRLPLHVGLGRIHEQIGGERLFAPQDKAAAVARPAAVDRDRGDPAPVLGHGRRPQGGIREVAEIGFGLDRRDDCGRVVHHRIADGRAAVGRSLPDRAQIHAAENAAPCRFRPVDRPPFQNVIEDDVVRLRLGIVGDLQPVGVRVAGRDAGLGAVSVVRGKAVQALLIADRFLEARLQHAHRVPVDVGLRIGRVPAGAVDVRKRARPLAHFRGFKLVGRGDLDACRLGRDLEGRRKRRLGAAVLDVVKAVFQCEDYVHPVKPASVILPQVRIGKLIVDSQHGLPRRFVDIAGAVDVVRRNDGAGAGVVESASSGDIVIDRGREALPIAVVITDDRTLLDRRALRQQRMEGPFEDLVGLLRRGVPGVLRSQVDDHGAGEHHMGDLLILCGGGFLPLIRVVGGQARHLNAEVGNQRRQDDAVQCVLVIGCKIDCASGL